MCVCVWFAMLFQFVRKLSCQTKLWISAIYFENFFSTQCIPCNGFQTFRESAVSYVPRYVSHSVGASVFFLGYAMAQTGIAVFAWVSLWKVLDLYVTYNSWCHVGQIWRFICQCRCGGCLSFLLYIYTAATHIARRRDWSHRLGFTGEDSWPQRGFYFLALFLKSNGRQYDVSGPLGWLTIVIDVKHRTLQFTLRLC